MTDRHDPFDRAARRLADVERAMDHRYAGIAPVAGFLGAWAVVLGLHWWLADGDGVLLAGHRWVFSYALGIGVTVVLVHRPSTRLTILAPAAGWAVVVAHHYWAAGGDGILLTLHVLSWGMLLSVSVLAAGFVRGSRSRRPGSMGNHRL